MNNKYIFENFFIKAHKDILKLPLPLETFKILSEEDIWDGKSYHTIPTYLATFGHEVRRFSTDNHFIKGFGFNIKALDEMRDKFADFGLIFEKNIWILSPEEIIEELKKDEWVEVLA